jgi:dTDP-4-amino-4,6-dideoxygalactose transaminase
MTKRIPFIDLATPHAEIREELLDAVGRVIDSGMFVMGPWVDELEQRVAARSGTQYCIGVANGTDALHLALVALGIGEGDQVITAANSFIASASAIALAGATPRFADIGDDLNLDPESVKAAITDRTKAILPVHLTGRPAQMDALVAIAAENKLAVVEDAAQAFAATHKGRAVGSFGALGCFSFHPLKNFAACGDGGAITTNDEGLCVKLRALRNHGLAERNNCLRWSPNSRLDSMQAAILLTKLSYFDHWTRERRTIAKYYDSNLRGVVTTPPPCIEMEPTYQTYVVRADRRDELAKHLNALGIDTRVHYEVPIHLQPAARSLGYGVGSLPRTEQFAKEILSLPIYAGLSIENQQRVVEGVRSFYV